MLGTPFWSTFHAASVSRHHVFRCRTQYWSSCVFMKDTTLASLGEYADQLRDHQPFCVQPSKYDPWDHERQLGKRTLPSNYRRWHSMVQLALILEFLPLRNCCINSNKQIGHLKYFYLIRPFVYGSCRTLFNEMGVRWWAVEPRHLEFGEKADKDRRSAKSIRLATSFFQAFTRQEALKCH